MTEQPDPAPHHGQLLQVSLADFLPLAESEDQYPLEYIESNGAIRLREDDAAVYVGLCDPTDSALRASLRNYHNKQVVFYRIDRRELSGHLGRRLAALGPGGGTEGSAGTDEERLLLDRLANDAPIVNLVNSLMIDGIRAGASDIHIESFASEMRVRYRVDGVLRKVATVDKQKSPGVSSRIKIMANLNIMERRLPQDGRITVHLAEEVYDVRVSIIPIADGESIVLRLFNKAGSPLALEDLGFETDSLAELRRLVAVPHGLVLATGPTGSGKTTTLNAILRTMPVESQKIITIEDPVEYLVEGVDQIQTHDSIGLTFDSLLRRVLRHDPNVIMVGEIRDPATADIAVRAALTGHLVLSTLHTNDAVSVIPRLVNMGVEPYLLGAVLRGALSQRLVRQVCENCCQPVSASAEEQAVLERHGLAMDRLRRGAGCDDCGGTGFRGRTAVAEIFISDPEVEAMIARSEQLAAITAHLQARGFRPLIHAGLLKASRGTTTTDEVEKAVLS